MITQMIPQPGSVVLNQNTMHPMGGTVIPTPRGLKGTDSWVWVKWDTGVESSEHLSDLTLTGVLYLDLYQAPMVIG